MTTAPPTPPVVRALQESEIQERLYGTYWKKRVSPAVQESGWTGSEILSGELQRLRSELISLRQEKERLAARLEQVNRLAPAAAGSGGPRAGGWVGRIFASLLLLGAAGYLVGGPMLQASPTAGDFTPYTVQVAVYDGRTLADRAQRLLKELGYDAFQVEIPRANGAPRYRIYVGRFVTKEEAAQESQRLAADTRFRDFKDAFVLIR